METMAWNNGRCEREALFEAETSVFPRTHTSLSTEIKARKETDCLTGTLPTFSLHSIHSETLRSLFRVSLQPTFS